MEQQKKEILGYFRGLDFDEKNHQYFINGNRIKLSVSGIIKKFVEVFDTQGISRKVAERRGVSQESILKEWDNEKNKACKKGTEVHLFGELYPFNNHLKPRNKHEEAVVAFWKDLPSTIIPVVMEIQMFHKEHLFAGTADILLYNTVTGKYIIGDYKTNKDLFKNYRGKKMLGPFSDLLDSPYNKYQLQLSFYQILLEQAGVEVSSRKLIWLKPNGKYELYSTEDYTEVLRDWLSKNKL